MGLIKLSALATQISGKVGNSVFGVSPSGSYIKSIGRSLPKVSSSQFKIRVLQNEQKGHSESR